MCEDQVKSQTPNLGSLTLRKGFMLGSMCAKPAFAGLKATPKCHLRPGLTAWAKKGGFCSTAKAGLHLNQNGLMP